MTLVSSRLTPHASRPHKPIEQRPRQHKAAQSSKHIAEPQVSERPVKVCAGFPLGFEGEQKHRDERCADEVEDESRVRL
jgi:hypothetical protein